MGREFELTDFAEVDATPEQLWEAIATGPGIDSWFMGRNQVDPGEGGRTRLTMGGHTTGCRRSFRTSSLRARIADRSNR